MATSAASVVLLLSMSVGAFDRPIGIESVLDGMLHGLVAHHREERDQQQTLQTQALSVPWICAGLSVNIVIVLCKCELHRVSEFSIVELSIVAWMCGVLSLDLSVGLCVCELHLSDGYLRVHTCIGSRYGLFVAS